MLTANIVNKKSASLEADFEFFNCRWERLLDDGYGTRLFALFAIGDFKFHALTFFERTITTALNFGIVDEEVRTTFLGDEAVTLVTVEPFNCTLYTSHVIYSLLIWYRV